MNGQSRILITLVLLGAAATAQAGTVGYWRFEEGAPDAVASGDVVDSSTNADHGTPLGFPTYRTDVPFGVIPQTGAPNGLSLELTSFEDLVSFSSAFPLNQPGDMTFEFWLKWSQIHNGATLWGRPDTQSDDNRFHLHGNFDFTLGLEYRSPNGDLHVLAGSGLPDSGVPFSPGKWGHIAIVRQGDVYRVYVNGVLQSTVTDTNPELPTSVGWSLGGRLGQPFFGLIDEVRVSDEALTPERFLLAEPPPPPVLSVKIDVKPSRCFGFMNIVDPWSPASLPVAILTTDGFDARLVDASSVRFGVRGTEAAGSHVKIHDADGDGDKDMVLHFRVRETGIRCDTKEVFLTGLTRSGQPFRGTDRIRTLCH
jgi:Concanavalin A-like lectin/glucanases superfamily